VLKIIFDRVESLKPWGIILGDEERKQEKLAKKAVVVEDGGEQVVGDEGDRTPPASLR